MHKRMASRFFPNSLKLSSDSAPEMRRSDTQTHKHLHLLACPFCCYQQRFFIFNLKLHAISQKRTELATVALHRAFSRTFGTLVNSPSCPWSLAASTQLLQGCPSIISGLGNDLRSATVAIAVEPSPRWICCCFSCCLAARRCSPLTSSSALSDILSATM